MLKFFKRLEIEWKIFIISAILMSLFAVPLQSIYINKLKTTLNQSVDPQLDKLLRSFISPVDNEINKSIRSSLSRSRQWEALIPIIVEEQAFAMCLISVILFIFLLCLSFWSLRRLTRPLRELAAAADKIGKGTVVTINQKSGGALGKLESSMLSMQNELVKLREKAHMQGMESAWRDIARVMAHEIKNPLTPIQLTLDRIVDRIDRGNELSKDEMIKFVNRIGTQVDNLERLVNDFRSFAKEPEPVISQISLKGCIDQIAGDMKGTIETIINGEDIMIDADAHLLQRVFLNIWKNSLEAGATVINTAVKQESGTTIMIIKDNGPGISEDQIEQIWIPYVTFKKGGTGLGLPVVKRLLESMNAAIELISDTSQENHGVTLIITFKNISLSNNLTSGEKTGL